MNKASDTQAAETQAAETQAPPEISLDEALARHNAAHPESRLVDITDGLTGAAARRLHSLLQARVNEPEWTAELNGVLAGLDTPRKRLSLLLVCAAGRAARRACGLSWERFQDVLMETGDPERRQLDAARIRRAVRLLKTLLRSGCLRRGEV